MAGQAQLLHDILIKSTIVDARGRLSSLQAGAPFADFVIEILMIKLQLLMAPDVTGYVHVQTNPKLSYSTRETLKNARRMSDLTCFRCQRLTLARHRGHLRSAGSAAGC